MTAEGRLVVVLGYSDGRGDELHPICAARLELAMRVADGARAVLLSGWSRRAGALPEAELMRRAWLEPSPPLVADPHARITAETAAHAARLAARLGVGEVLVVTSWWHRLRTAVCFRLALRGRGIRLALASARGPWSARLLLRELLCLPLVPFQLARVRRRLRRE